MKNIFRFLALAAAGASAIVSCNKNEIASQNGGEDIFFSLKTGETKTYIVADGNKYLPKWTKGDQVGVLFEGFTDDKSSPAGRLENTEDSGDVASFEGKIQDVATEGTLYAFYPSAIAKTYSGQTVGFDIAVNQKPSATSFDPEADLLISKPVFYYADNNQVLIDDVQFARALAILKINIYSTDFEAIQGQYLSKLTVTAKGDTLAGRPVFDLTKGDAKVIKYNTKSESVSAIYNEDIVSVGSSKTATGCSVFLMAAPVTIDKDVTLKFEGETSGYTIAKEVTLSSDIVLTPGLLTEINLSITEENCEVKENVDYSGDYLIVSGKYLLTDYNTSKYYNLVEAAGTELSDFWGIPNIEDYVWTVAKLADGSYSFCNAGSGKYLALTAESNNAHEAEETDENTSMTITKKDDASLTVQSKKFEGRTLRCNTSSPRFAFYGGTSTLPLATLLAYTSDSRTPFDAVSGLAWDASSKTLSWTAVEGAGNGYEYTTDAGTTVTPVDANTIDCSGWTNGDYSVKVRVVGTDARKTSEWSEACEFTISGGEVAKEFKLFTSDIEEGDYVIYYGGNAMKAEVSNSRLTYIEVTPSNDVIANPDASIIWHIADSGEYWTIYNESVSKFAASTGSKNQATLNDNGTDDKSLWTVTLSGSAYEFVNKQNAASRVNSNLRNNGTYGFACYATSTGGALSLYKLVEPAVTAIVVSGTPTKTSYRGGDEFETAGLVATATYDEASTKVVTDDVEWTVTPTPLTAGTTSVSVVATYKKVSSEAYVVNGITVTEAAELTSISVKTAPTKVEYIKGEKFDPAGLVITRNYSDQTSDEYAYAGNESDFTFNPALETALTTDHNKVTITYKGKTVDQAITVKSIANTKETAYTVSEARALIDAGKDLDTEVYVKGKISEIVTAYDSKYGNISFNISANGSTEGDQFQFFRNFKDANKTKWTDSDKKPAVGNEVIGFGKLTKYGSTYEFAEGNYIVSITEAPYLNASATKTSGISADGEEITINVDTNIGSWEAVSSDDTNFKVGSKTATSIKVTVAKNTDTEKDRTATITVSAEGVDDVVITLTQSKAGSVETKTLIIDGSTLTSTATTAAADYTYGDFTITMSDGAKAQSSSGNNKFTSSAILIGKSGKYIYNKTPIPGKITKFEIYANKGASANVSVGVLFSTTAISAYATGTNTYTATLSTLDNVYDCSSKIPDGAKYFWYQVTNANNSQVQFRITYTAN